MTHYRWRTWLREHGIPLPKGQNCGAGRHELYMTGFRRVQDKRDLFRCYHCRAKFYG